MNILGFNDGPGMTIDSQTDDHDDEKSQRRRQIQNAMFILPHLHKSFYQTAS